MNYHLRSIDFKKYALILICSLAFMAITAWYLEVYFQRLYGDLTRVGCFPERYFGWTLERPKISEQLLKGYSLEEADILVIGDSFSEPRIWQSRFVAAGFKIAFIHWNQLNHIVGDKSQTGTLSEDIAEVLKSSGFKGHYVIIESIERLFQSRMSGIVKQGQAFKIRPFSADIDSHYYPISQRKIFSLDKLNGIEWNINALHNTLRLWIVSPKEYVYKNVLVTKLDSCSMFSHTMCQYALFVYDDFYKKTFTSIDKVLFINNQLKSAGIQAIWAVIPDKSTVYLGYGQSNKYYYQNIWQAFAQHPDIMAPDLGTLFIKQSRLTKDFYMPNDAHLGINGYLYLGDLLLTGLGKLQANQERPFFFTE